MTKLELQTKYLLGRLSNGAAEEDKEKELSTALKTFVCDAVNVLADQQEGGAAWTLIVSQKDLLKEYGIKYNGKTKTFS